MLFGSGFLKFQTKFQGKMANGYFTVGEEFENLIIIERSKFICRVKGVAGEEDAKRFIESVKKEHSLATHNCYAYIADEKGLTQKFSDDGEPQGTAGLPMLEVLKNRKIYKVAVVVTRYFGGVKLGTGGLARAYGGSVCEALDKANILDMQAVKYYKVTADYDKYSLLLKLASENVVIIDAQFTNGVEVSFAVKEDYEKAFTQKLDDIFSGKPNYIEKGEGYHAFKK